MPSTTATEEAKLKEEDDLQLAIAMSLNEQENKVGGASVGSHMIKVLCNSHMVFV